MSAQFPPGLVRFIKVNAPGHHQFAAGTVEELTARKELLHLWMRAYARTNVQRARDVSLELADLRAAIAKATGQ